MYAGSSWRVFNWVSMDMSASTGEVFPCKECSAHSPFVCLFVYLCILGVFGCRMCWLKQTRHSMYINASQGGIVRFLFLMPEFGFHSCACFDNQRNYFRKFYSSWYHRKEVRGRPESTSPTGELKRWRWWRFNFPILIMKTVPYNVLYRFNLVVT